MASMNRTHAVVLGASMAGLASARALHNHFARVTVIERDVLDSSDPRKGVPQGNHAHGLLQIFDVGPRHRLEVHRQTERCAKIAQRRESLRQPRRVWVVAGDEYMPRSESRAGFQRGMVVLDSRVWFDAEDFDIQHCDAGVGKTPLDFAHERGIADDRPRGLAIGGGDQA